MNWKPLAALGTLTGAGMLVYGALYESKNLQLEKHTLHLPHWPDRLAGFKIAVLADLHIRDIYSVELAKRAVGMALDQSPDVVVLPGDMIGYWKHGTAAMVAEVLEPLLLLQGNAIAVPGNHEYWSGRPEWLKPVLAEVGVKLLQNESYFHLGINWVGVDSGNAGFANPYQAIMERRAGPSIALWHEPDMVDYLPLGCSLMISGHSHGGQFRFPGGLVPMTTKHGKKYKDGFFPNARTPLYVSRGVGTTGPPTRFLCPPEVSLLTLLPL